MSMYRRGVQQLPEHWKCHRCPKFSVEIVGVSHATYMIRENQNVTAKTYVYGQPVSTLLRHVLCKEFRLQYPVPVLSRLVMRVRTIEVDKTSDNPLSDGVCVSLAPWIPGVMVCFRLADLNESLDRDHDHSTHVPNLSCSCCIWG